MHHCGETTDGFYLTTLSTVEWLAVGQSAWQYGGKARIESVAPSTKCVSVCLSPSWDWTRTMAVSLLISTCMDIVRGRALPSLALAPTRRMIAAM